MLNFKNLKQLQKKNYNLMKLSKKINLNLILKDLL
jgi:hypothetical protein